MSVRNVPPSVSTLCTDYRTLKLMLVCTSVFLWDQITWRITKTIRKLNAWNRLIRLFCSHLNPAETDHVRRDVGFQAAARLLEQHKKCLQNNHRRRQEGPYKTFARCEHSLLSILRSRYINSRLQHLIYAHHDIRGEKWPPEKSCD